MHLKNTLNEELFAVIVVHMFEIFAQKLDIEFAVFVALRFLQVAIKV